MSAVAGGRADRRRMTGILFLMTTAVGWGLNWSILKMVLQDWTPLFARGMAGIGGALVLGAFALLRGESLAIPRGARLRVAAAAATNVFAWMGFTALALQWLKVSEGVLIAYTMPIWATLLAWPVLGERPGRASILALVLGVAGIAVLMGGPHLDAAKAPGIAFALGAALLFAVGTVTSRQTIAMPAIARTAWQVFLGCVPMVVLGLLFEEPRLPALSAQGAAGLVFMALGPMALCYVAWFEALNRLPTATAATGMLIVPLVGTISAMLLLGDPIGGREIVAIVITLCGVGVAIRSA